MTPDERKLAEKELQGLKARLKWNHIPEVTKDVWRLRIEQLREKLRA